MHHPVIATFLLKHEPAAPQEAVNAIALVWESVVDSVIESMLAYAAPKMKDPHIDLREEMTLELARLRAFLCQQVVIERKAGRLIKDIDPTAEEEHCFNQTGKARITATAQVCPEQIWLRINRERWEPKTTAALIREKASRKPRDVVSPQVTDNHFIPKSFIKRYWSEGQFVYRSIKTSTEQKEKVRTPSGSWGFNKNLYSDRLEAYFGLLEGDATEPIRMILKVEPLNRPQREALVGFIVIQRLRNPAFIRSITTSIAAAFTSKVSIEDKTYMQAVYESICSQNDFYDNLARPILYSSWVVVRSTKPDFVLPDVCNLFGEYGGRRFVLMPLTPNDCLVVLPIEVARPRIVPHYIQAPPELVRDISFVLRHIAEDEFLSDKDASFDALDDDAEVVISRTISALSKLATENSSS